MNLLIESYNQRWEPEDLEVPVVRNGAVVAHTLDTQTVRLVSVQEFGTKQFQAGWYCRPLLENGVLSRTKIELIGPDVDENNNPIQFPGKVTIEGKYQQPDTV